MDGNDASLRDGITGKIRSNVRRMSSLDYNQIEGICTSCTAWAKLCSPNTSYGAKGRLDRDTLITRMTREDWIVCSICDSESDPNWGHRSYIIGCLRWFHPLNLGLRPGLALSGPASGEDELDRGESFILPSIRREAWPNVWLSFIMQCLPTGKNITGEGAQDTKHTP